MNVVWASPQKSKTPEVIPILEQNDWQITSVASGAKALSEVQRIQAPVAILDVKLPDITGWDVVQTLRQSPLTKRTVVILIYPAGAPDHDYFKGHSVGADLNLSSPFNPREVLAFLSRIRRGIETN